MVLCLISGTELPKFQEYYIATHPEDSYCPPPVLKKREGTKY